MRIVALSRNPSDSDTAAFFSQEILNSQPFGTNVRVVRDTTESIRQVANNPGAIAYASTSAAIGQQVVQVIPIAKDSNQPFVSPCGDENCRTLNKEAVINFSYPLSRRLFVVIKQDGGIDEKAGIAFANLLLSDEGQRLVEEAGYVPIRNSK